MNRREFLQCVAAAGVTVTLPVAAIEKIRNECRLIVSRGTRYDIGWDAIECHVRVMEMEDEQFAKCTDTIARIDRDQLDSMTAKQNAEFWNMMERQTIEYHMNGKSQRRFVGDTIRIVRPQIT